MTPPAIPCSVTNMRASLRPYRPDDFGPPILVASHPRSGTHLTIDLLRGHFPACQVRLRWLESVHHAYLTLETLAATRARPLLPEDGLAILRRAERPIVKTHERPGFPGITGPARPLAQAIEQKSKVIYVLRDCRDVLMSTHVWRMQYHPETRVPVAQFLRQTYDGLPWPHYWAHHVRAWLGRPGVTVVHYQDLLDRPGEVLTSLEAALGLHAVRCDPLLPPRPPKNRLESYWGRLSGHQESSGIHGRYRGIRPKRWRDALTREDRAYVCAAAGELLVDLGFERDEGWVDG